MNSIKLQQLIKSEIRRLIQEGDGYPVQISSDDMSTNPVDANTSDVLNLPGAPFGGRLYAAQLSVIPNEARESLKKWAKLCQMAKTKYGEATAWPALVKQAAIELGRQVETQLSNTTPKTGAGGAPSAIGLTI